MICVAIMQHFFFFIDNVFVSFCIAFIFPIFTWSPICIIPYLQDLLQPLSLTCGISYLPNLLLAGSTTWSPYTNSYLHDLFASWFISYLQDLLLAWSQTLTISYLHDLLIAPFSVQFFNTDFSLADAEERSLSSDKSMEALHGDALYPCLIVHLGSAHGWLTVSLKPIDKVPVNILINGIL